MLWSYWALKGKGKVQIAVLNTTENNFLTFSFIIWSASELWLPISYFMAEFLNCRKSVCPSLEVMVKLNTKSHLILPSFIANSIACWNVRYMCLHSVSFLIAFLSMTSTKMILSKYLGTHNLLHVLCKLVLPEWIQCPPAVICNSE